MKSENCTAFILAGGKSSRMGTDKGLLDWFGKPICLRIIEELNQVFENVILVSNSEEYFRFGLPIIKDEVEEKGPLGGIYTALQYTDTENNFIISCDNPFITSEAINFFTSNSIENQITVAKIENNLQPLFGFYPKGLIPDIIVRIQENKLKMTDFITYHNCHQIDMDKWKPQFENINTPIDYFLSRRIIIPV